MYSIVSFMVVFCIFFAVQERALATGNGYIVFELEKISCKNSSSALPPCSSFLDYNFPDFTNSSAFSGLSDSRNLTLTAISSLKLFGEECSKSGTKYLCEVAYPFRCQQEYIGVDTNELLATCNDSRKNCSSLVASVRDSLFNCSAIAVIYNMIQNIPRKLSCKTFPDLKDDPYTCAGNYKVSASNEAQMKKAYDQIVMGHNLLRTAGLSDAQCEKDVAEALCKTIPACSKDQTKLVSLLSKQDCRDIVACLNHTNSDTIVGAAYSVCESFPDGNPAKAYPLDNVYETIEATSVPNEVDSTKRPTSKAGTLNSRMNELAFLVLSILLISMY